MADSVQYHLQLAKKDLQGAQYAIVPGDPGRVASLAKMLDPEAKALQSHREYTSFLADFHGAKILLCSTGIGGPSTSICMEELANLGILYFLRIGTCGAIQPHIAIGDLVISKAAVRLDGCSEHYAPLEYPACASFESTWAMVQAARQLQVPHHVGLTVSSASFYPGQERYSTHSGYLIRRFQGSMKEWENLKVLNFEMESATLFTLANVFGLEAACICGVVANRHRSEVVDPTGAKKVEANWHQVMVKGLEIDMRQRMLIE